MESYLFIGGAGFIGSNLIRYYLGQENHPRIIVLEPQYADVSRLDNYDIKLVQGNLNDTNIIENTITRYKCSHVFHLVSNIKPNSSYNEYLNELQNVVVPTVRLFGICQRHNTKLVYFSSGGAIYGACKEGKSFCEESTLNPISYYGLSKLIIEANIRLESRANGLKYTILRPSNPYGIGQRINSNQGFIANAIGKILKGKPITIWGDGSIVRDYIYIEDLSRCVYNIISRGCDNETINIGSGIGLSLNDVAKEIEDVVGISTPIEYQNARKFDIPSVVLDTTKLQNYVDCTMTPIRDGIKKLYKHLLDK